jgi:hypothetical protein
MAKEDLRPARTKEEAKERGRNGGIASGKARREKRMMREALEKELGKSLKDITLALLEKAKSGDVRAFEVIRDTIGEKPAVEIGSGENPLTELTVKFIG